MNMDWPSFAIWVSSVLVGTTLGICIGWRARGITEQNITRSSNGTAAHKSGGSK